MELHNERDVSIVLPTITSDARGWVTGAGGRPCRWLRQTQRRAEEGLEEREEEKKQQQQQQQECEAAAVGWPGVLLSQRSSGLNRKAMPWTEAPRQHGAVDRDFSYTAIRRRGRTAPTLKGSLELNTSHDNTGCVKEPLAIKYTHSPFPSAGQNINVLE